MENDKVVTFDNLILTYIINILIIILLHDYIQLF